MENKNKIVPKIVKSHLRGVLLSKSGVHIHELLHEYNRVTKTPLDYQGMGFTHIVEFLKSIPDVARIVYCGDGSIRVLGIALNEFNITANKSCFKESNCDLNFSTTRRPKVATWNQSPPRGSKPYDFRVEFMRNECPQIRKMSADSEDETDRRGFKDMHPHVEKSEINGIIPRSMLLCKLQQMFGDIYPGRSPFVSGDFQPNIEVMITHVESRYKNYFWGIIYKPYRPEIDVVLSLNDLKNDFTKYKGGKRAVIFHENCHYRAWVKAVEGDTASVFLMDLGNSEEVLAGDLVEGPPEIWKCLPLAIPFRYDPKKNYYLENHVNEPIGCRLSRQSGGHIFVVEELALI